MTIKGQVQDSSNNKPISGVTFTVSYSGNFGGPANGTFTSDQMGNYAYTDASLDTAPAPAVSAQANGYLEAVGDPGFFNGITQLDPAQTTTNNIPTWVWIVIGVLGVVGIIYFNKKYKFLK